MAEKKTGMTDQELTLQAVSKAQRIIEEYLQPIPHDHERLLDRLLQVLDGNDVVAAVDAAAFWYAHEIIANSGWLSRGDRLPAVFSLFEAAVPAVMN